MILSKGLHVHVWTWITENNKSNNIFLREKNTLPCILKLFHRIVFFPQNYDKWALIQSKVYFCLEVKISYVNGSVLIDRYDVLSNSICSWPCLCVFIMFMAILRN